jgi:hypothetical protein
MRVDARWSILEEVGALAAVPGQKVQRAGKVPILPLLRHWTKSKTTDSGDKSLFPTCKSAELD